MFYRKECDRYAYLHRKSENPESLKRRIQFTQVLREFQDTNKQRTYKQTVPHFTFFHLVWGGICCYSIKGFVFLVLFA